MQSGRLSSIRAIGFLRKRRKTHKAWREKGLGEPCPAANTPVHAPAIADKDDAVTAGDAMTDGDDSVSYGEDGLFARLRFDDPALERIVE